MLAGQSVVVLARQQSYNPVELAPDLTLEIRFPAKVKLSPLWRVQERIPIADPNVEENRNPCVAYLD